MGNLKKRDTQTIYEKTANLAEAGRCLGCKVALCQKGCPVETPIKEIISLYLEDNSLIAGEILFKNNPLSVVCSLVCPHEKQCEGNCVLNKKFHGVQFGKIENEISSNYIENIDFHVHRKNNKRKKVAIIGGGPAGITIAFILAFKGYDITIFESHSQIGGVLRYGIPEFRLPKSIIDKLEEKLIEVGVKIRPNILIGPTITIDNLFQDGYQAIFIGTGTWNPRKLDIKGESFGHVHYAIDYLKSPKYYKLGETVIIIGAGNVALDAARTMLRNGVKDVTVLNRSGENGITANKEEYYDALSEGVKVLNFTTPIEIIDEGICVGKTKISANPENPQELIYGIVENTDRILKADAVVIAVSQGPRANIVSKDKNIEVNTQGLIITHPDGSTTKKGVFSGGDVVTGAKTVVEAVKMSKIIAETMDNYLVGITKEK